MATADPWEVTLNNRGYMVDREAAAQGAFNRQSVQMIRQQSDTSGKPGEQSLNPAGLWHRAAESWHKGAGQTWFDRPDSDPSRFRTSKGVDPWTKYQLSLLPATTLVRGDTSTNQWLASASDRVFHSDGDDVYVSNVLDPTVWVAATGKPAANVASLASDGTYCYAAYGTAGIYRLNGTAMTSYVTGTVNLVRYVKGRLMAANGPSIYNPTAAGALPAALYTHSNPSWTWADFCTGRGFIYAAGGDRGKSIIYKIGIGTDAAGLDLPVVAGETPEGEVIYSLTEYLGYIIVGTSNGVRFAVADASGFLTLGSLIPTAQPVRCAEGQDRFVWYGWTNFDGTSTGLGRFDLQTFTGDLTPAYASDLMATAQGIVKSVLTFNDRRLFTIEGVGVYQEALTKVASGTVTTGKITYDLPDTKTLIRARVNHEPLPAATSIALAVAVDQAAAASIGTSNVTGSTEYDGFNLTPPLVGRTFEVTATLTGDCTLTRLTLLSDPSADRTELIKVPLLLRSSVVNGAGEQAVDVAAEKAALRALWQNRTVVTYVEGSDTQQVVVDDFQWIAYDPKRDRTTWQGTHLVTLKVVG